MHALVELTFCIDSRLKEKLEQYDVYPEDENIIVVSRKITYGRSVSKINGETVSLTTLKNVMDLLIDIHGQHDHQSLLYKNTHLQILDKYAGEEVKELKNTISDKYSQYIEIKKELDKFDMDETKRLRECEFAEFEINEIEAANLSLGEDDEVENEFKKLSGSEKIMSSLSDAYQIMGYEGNQGVCECISRVGYDLSEISDIDSKLSDLQKQIYDIDDMCKGLAREISDYIDEVNYEPQRVAEVEERLNLINHLKLKYGQSIEKILAYKGEKQAYLDSLNNYNLMREETKTKLDKEMSELVVLCDKLSSLRKKYAIKLEETVVKALEDLNFLSVKFKINVSKKENVSANGQDEVEFLISTNPGEEVKSLAKVASGGELSRIMLAIKSILAGEDEIDTMIFDEIDTGISGKTAQMVADKLMGISKEHQVICISHLAQIAAMADSHYLIEKNTDDESTETNIYRLSREDSIKELVRISSGGEITETAIKHATEMKEMAERAKLGQF